METAHEQVLPQENSAHIALAKEQLCLAMQSTQGTRLHLCQSKLDYSAKSYPCDSTTLMSVYTRNFCQEAQNGDKCHLFIWHLLVLLVGCVCYFKT